VPALQAPAPGGAPPQAPSPSADPAAVQFTTEVGLLLVAIKPGQTKDYEAVLLALQDRLATQTDPRRRALAQGWRVYKATEPDAKGNVLYVHALLPVVPGADYRPSLLLDELVAEAPTELLAKYKEAFASPPTRLSLTEFAHMAVAPVRK
jgi:hypothetical protein